MITKRKELRAGLTMLALTLALASVPACKTMQTPPGGQTTDQAQARLVEINKIADLTEKAVDLIAAAQDTEIAVYEAKLVAELTPQVHADIQTAFKTFSNEARKQLPIAQDVSATDANRRSAVSSIIKSARTALDAVKINNPLVKASIQAAIGAIDFLNLAVS